MKAKEVRQTCRGTQTGIKPELSSIGSAGRHRLPFKAEKETGMQSPPTAPAERGGETSGMPRIAWQTAAAHPDLDPFWTNEG